MFLKAKKMKKILAFALALGLAVPSVPGWQNPVVVEAAEEVTLDSVRAEAAASYASAQAKGFDLDLSEQTFDGNTCLDYSTDADGRKYMAAFNNLRQGTDDQTVIVRFKTTVGGLLFGVGADTNADAGKNMTFAVASSGNDQGKLRPVIRNTKNGTVTRGLKGYFGTDMRDGAWHTIAMSFRPSAGKVNDNIRLVIDGGNELYASTGWGSAGWVGGLNQGTSELQVFQIGGGRYVKNVGTVTNDDYANNGFNGEIDFITVINKAYTTAELQKITEGDKSEADSFAVMTEGGSKNMWLFTGGTEGVADFHTSGTTRNYVGLFEDNLRAGGSYIERSRFVFNTAKRGTDVAYLLEHYDTMIAPYHTKAVGIMIGAADYTRGTEGLEAFKANLTALLEKIYDADKLPFIMTPYPSGNAADTANISVYTDAIREAAGKRTRVINLSGIAAANVSDGSLTPAGHQAVANQIKNTLGVGQKTNFDFALAGGVYTVAKKTADGMEAEVKEVTAGADSITVSVDADSVNGTSAKLEYVLKDAKGQEWTAAVPAGKTSFTVDGLKTGETYTLYVYDAGRTNVKESYRPVSITVAAGETGVSVPYDDGNKKVNEKIQALLTSSKPVTYLFMGDSITHGIVTSGYDNVPQMFAKYLDEIGRTDDVVLNTGVSNATIATTNAQIEQRLQFYDPDVVMIMLGTNDVSTNGENTVNANGSVGRNGITAEQFKDRYKTLVRYIHENNADSSIVLRIPCEMLVDGPHSGYEAKFHAINEVAAEMREEIAGLNIAVVDHRQEWLDYQSNVRNDNIARGTTYGWLVDNVHPNGRGNLSMFQQIVKELGLYVPTSEMANYTYALDDWSGSSALQASVVQKGTDAELNMSALSGYANGLKEVTLKLTASDGKSVSKTAAYDAAGVLRIEGLESGKTYTAAVTGKDANDSKTIRFAANIRKENVAPTGVKVSALDQKTTLTKANETTQLTVNVEPANAETEGVVFVSSDPSVASVDANGVVTAGKNGTAVITVTLAGTEIKDTIEIQVACPDVAGLTSEIEAAKKINLEGFTAVSAEAFRAALAEAEKVLANTQASADEVAAVLKKLADAKAGLKKETIVKTPLPEVGKIAEVNGAQYQVTKSDAFNGTVTFVKYTGKKKKAVVPAEVRIDGYLFKVTAIAKGAFQKNKKVTSVVIGSNIKTIGAKAFFKCSKLKNVKFLGVKAPKISGKAFKGIKANCTVRAPKKMKAKQFKKLKKQMKNAGAGKKVKYKNK